MEKEGRIKNISFAEVLTMKELVTYEEARVVSRTLAQREDLSITLFAFAEGEGLNTHSAPGDALVYILDGSVEIAIGDDTRVTLSEGETVVMPAKVPHGLKAVERFKMLLIVVKRPKTSCAEPECEAEL